MGECEYTLRFLAADREVVPLPSIGPSPRQPGKHDVGIAEGTINSGRLGSGPAGSAGRTCSSASGQTGGSRLARQRNQYISSVAVKSCRTKSAGISDTGANRARAAAQQGYGQPGRGKE